MKKILLSAIALLCFAPLAAPASGQVVVRLGHGHYHHHYYHHRHYYHHHY